LFKNIYKSQNPKTIIKERKINQNKMDTTKLVGYILAIAGLGIITLSNTINKIPFIASMAKGSIYVIVAGIALIVAGLALALTNSTGSKVKHAAPEVPIYEGQGKNRRIVGYQKA